MAVLLMSKSIHLLFVNFLGESAQHQTKSVTGHGLELAGLGLDAGYLLLPEYSWRATHAVPFCNVADEQPDVLLCTL